MDNEIFKEYRTAIWNAQDGYNALLEDFKVKYPKEYKLITSMYRKRVILKDILNAFTLVDYEIVWFTLTFDNRHDKSSISNKRKQAIRHLNKVSPYYLLVEEFGEDNKRYHIHGFLFFDKRINTNSVFETFNNEWHSRRQFRVLSENDFKRKIHYLTNYSVKSCPRLRKSKKCIKVYDVYKHNYKAFKYVNEDYGINEFNKCVIPYLLFDI